MVLVRELKDKFDEGEQVALKSDDMDVHSVASLLKQYLRELPECLIPYRHYQEYMNIAMRFQGTAKSEDKMEQVDTLRASVASLPPDNYNVLKCLCRFLKEVDSKTHINKMTALNLATVFGPNIIRHPNMEDNPEIFMLTTADISQQLAFMLINHSDQIFTINFETDGKSVPVAVDDLLNIGDEDINSTLSPLPFSKPIEPTAIDELSDIKFEQRGDRRARSIQANEWMSVELQLNNPDSETSSTHSYSDDSPRETKPPLQLGEDGKPIPPMRRKFKRGALKNEKCETSLKDSDNSKGREVDNFENKIDGVKSEQPSSEVVKLQDRIKQLEDLYDQLKFKYDELYQKKSRCDDNIKTLSAENSRIQSRYEEHIKNLETKHKAHMQELCAKLDKESASRAECVEKIVELKAKIHSYELQHGSIGNSVSDIYKIT